MFGYVSIYKPELKFKEYYEFRGFYCGLCHTLYKRYGLMGQLTLTYDMAFLICLLTSLYDVKPHLTNRRCIMHPVKKTKCLENKISAYGADMNMALTYHKLRDDYTDDKNIAALAASGIIKKDYKRIAGAYPRQCRSIEKELSELDRLQKKYTSFAPEFPSEEADLTSATFGRLMQELFVIKEDDYAEDLRRMGFFLGKFIYLLDAYDDLEQDIKKGNYNPLKRIADKEGNAYVEEMINLNMGECTAAYERLPIEKDEAIIRNVLYQGVWNRYERIRDKKNNGK